MYSLGFNPFHQKCVAIRIYNGQAFNFFQGLGMGCKLCKGLLQKGVTSMYHFTVTTGHLISLVIVVSGWFPSGNMLENLDMAIYFLCLACGCFFSLLLFIFAINRLDFNQPPPLTTYQSVSRSQDTFL